MASFQNLSFGGTGAIRLPVGNNGNRSGNEAGKLRYNTDVGGIEFANGSGYEAAALPTQFEYRKPSGSFLTGLAGKFYNGNWRETFPGIQDGNIGGYDTLPLTTTNNSSNITNSQTGGLAYGLNRWTSINWTVDQGDLYGGIWVGYFIPPSSGTWTFYTSSDDGSGCWVDVIAKGQPGSRTKANATLDNNLGAGQGRVERSDTADLVGGRWYPIRIVWEEIGGGDNMTFWYSGPGVARTTSLTNHFRMRSNWDLGNYGDY
jgi:hypothetical protein